MENGFCALFCFFYTPYTIHHTPIWLLGECPVRVLSERAFFCKIVRFYGKNDKNATKVE